MLPDVELAPGVHGDLVAAAVAASPREFAGVLGGARTATSLLVDTFVPLPNVAAGGDRFEIPTAAFAAAEAQLRADGHVWLGFVHGHPRGDAVPSLTDRRELWRDCLQLIVAGNGRGPGAVRAYWLRGDAVHALAMRSAATTAGENA